MPDTTEMIYLDHAATTPVRPQARLAMEPYLTEAFGNPSGVHAVSRRAKNAVEEAREQAAQLIGAARPLEIVFTGGGTEADNLAVAGSVLARSIGGAVISAIEHEAVLETAAFLERLGRPVRRVPPDSEGRVEPAQMAAAVDDDTVLVSLMTANNEVGATQQVAVMAELVRAADRDVLVHTDAVQSFVSEAVTVGSTGVDLMTIASHKLGGPKGVGLLYVRDGVDLEPVLHGGGQELDRRSGTHNVAGIVGFVEAMASTVADRSRFRRDVGEARRRFEMRLAAEIPDIVFNGPIEERLIQHTHVRIPGVDAETLLIRLDQAGVAASAGSACHSGAVEVSHVLAAMGLPAEHAAECARFTFGWTSTVDEADAAAHIVGEVARTLR